VAEAGLRNCTFREGDASHLAGIADRSFELVVSIFGAMFAPKPFDVAKEMVRVTRPGGRIVMGNWIPNDPTLVAQILKVSSEYTPPPPEGFVSPMTWGLESNVIERFGSAGVPADKIAFDTRHVQLRVSRASDGTAGGVPEVLRADHECLRGGREEWARRRAAEEARGAVRQPEQEPAPDTTSIPATFLRVTVTPRS
jgi:SAM-dependent methyltransferase